MLSSSKIKINCKPCQADKCDECLDEKKCLCAVDTKHNAPSLKDGVRVDMKKVSIPDLIDMYVVEESLKFDTPKRIDEVCKVLNEFFNFTNPYELMMYDGMIYSNDKAKMTVKQWAEKLIPNCSKAYRNEVLSKMEVKTSVDLSEFDSNPDKLTLLSGILDLSTMKQSPHTPDNLSKILIPLKFSQPKFKIRDETIFKDIEKNLKDTMFYQYLVRSFTINGKLRKDDLETVLENIASVFIKRPIDDRAFIHLGDGKNGKSILLKYIASLLGDENYVSIPLQTIDDDKYSFADLEGMLANIYADLKVDALRDSGTSKAIIAGDPIRAQKKYGHGFTLKNFATFIYSCNKFPKASDQSSGFFRRWIIIQWDRNFSNDVEAIPDLAVKLIDNKEEQSRVFSSLVYLTNKINREGKFTHTKSNSQTQKLWNENANPIESFMLNYLIVDLDEKSRKTKIETFQFYKQTMYDLGELPLSMRKFGDSMKESFDDDKTDGVRYWLHLDFKVPKQTKLKEVSQ